MKKTSVATHSGNFHPDDVFSVALLSIFFSGKIKIIRTRDINIYSKADFVLDIGSEYNPKNKKYDHHQEGGSGKRMNGISYSTFGLLWKDFGERVCGSKKVADVLDIKLVQVIDADDICPDLYESNLSGIYPYLLTDIIYSKYPTWKERNISLDEVFLEEVNFAKNIILREIKIETDNIEAEKVIDKIYKKSKSKEVIIFENPHLPSSLLSKYSEVLFVIKPEKDGESWKITAIRDSEKILKSRKLFPKEWRGKCELELVKITGVDDVVFCHNSGVFAGAKTREGAIKLAKLAVNF
ncbi:MAG: MYG1 family protein [Minisyncoccia bacterium]